MIGRVNHKLSRKHMFRHLLISLAVGAGTGLLFFAALFVVWGTIGGAMGTAPVLSNMYMSFVQFTAENILGLPTKGSFFAVCLFWAVASALLAFICLRVKLTNRHTNSLTDK